VNRWEVRASALVRAAALDDPHMLTIGVGVDSSDYTHLSPIRQFAPVIDHLIRVVGYGLR
jgi:hypothetical protein